MTAAVFRRLAPWLQYVLPALVLIAALLFKNLTLVADELQLKVFDTFQRIQPRIYEPQPVKLLDIDDESLRRIGQWPWPRTLLAEMVAKLANLGAAAIVFDVVFAEPDRTSPANILPFWPDTPETAALKAKAETLPDHDAIFADIVGQSQNVVTGFVLSGGTLERMPERKSSFAQAGDPARPFLIGYVGAVNNLSAIEKASAGNGSFNVDPETDGIIRRVPLFVTLRGIEIDTAVDAGIYPTLAIEALRVAQGAKTFIIKASGASGETAFGEHTGINNVKVGRYQIPTDNAGRLWLHDTGVVRERYIPAWRAVAGELKPEEVEGHILVVGTSAAGLQDIRTTPLSKVVPGAEVHIQILEQILSGHYLERPDWAQGLEYVYLVLLGVALIVLIPLVGAAWTGLIGLGATVGVNGASWLLYANERWLLDPIMPTVATGLIFTMSSVMNYLRTEAEKQAVRGAFSRYMSPALVEQLAKDPSRLVLGGEMRDMTLLFADIRGFTTISEQFKGDPQGLTRLINRFLTPMTDMILQRRGTIDKYMGDAIMAFWNAPLDDEQHAAHALDAALSMFGAIEAVNNKIKAEAEAEGGKFFMLKLGIGLNSGVVCVGNMGSDQRFDYSVLGDPVNLASRLEGQSKNYGVGIVLGEETQKRASDFATLELDLIAVKGKKEAVRIFTVLGPPAMKNEPKFQALAREHIAMLAAYRGQKWQDARAHLKNCQALDGAIPDFYSLYAERFDFFEQNPPGPDWDGVFVATSK